MGGSKPDHEPGRLHDLVHDRQQLVERVSRSTRLRSRVENAWMVWAALYLRRLNRRSATAWMRRRAG